MDKGLFPIVFIFDVEFEGFHDPATFHSLIISCAIFFFFILRIQNPARLFLQQTCNDGCLSHTQTQMCVCTALPLQKDIFRETTIAPLREDNFLENLYMWFSGITDEKLKSFKKTTIIAAHFLFSNYYT